MASISRKKQNTEVRPLTDLPFDIICIIKLKIGAKLSIDLSESKDVMEEAGESHLVYRKLDTFGLLNRPILMHIMYKRHKTFEKCTEHGNLLLLFRDGVFDFFQEGDKTNLWLAGEKGERHVIFLNAMLMLAENGNNGDALRMLKSIFRGSRRSDEVRRIFSHIRDLSGGRELKFHGILRNLVDMLESIIGGLELNNGNGF